MEVFRKQRERLSRHFSEEDQDRDGNGDRSDDVICNDWAVEGKQKRASEPLISYTSVLDHGSSQSENKIQQNISATGSGIPILNVPPIRPVSPYSLSTTNPLGLTLVYAFPHPILDVVFLHGLGGTSRGTWSWEHDPANFWPLWLPDDVEFSRTRIFTFGYNAAMTGQYTSLNILDFAKDLLFRMKTYLGDNEQGNTQIGKRPIIFVAHSMGGLVVKKAYIIGKSDQQYTNLIARVSAIVFLATPHKGSAFAQTLNNILRASPGGSSKTYVAELEKNSPSLQDINEQFRNICGDLELVSFYETIKTSLGAGLKKLLVDKDSALLEYPGETSSCLIADHHGMVKFKNSLDTNYINVKNLLKWLVRKIADEGCVEQAFSFQPKRAIMTAVEKERKPTKEISVENQLANILGISENIEEDLEYLVDRAMPGSCQWLLQLQSFQDWASDNPSTPGLLWLTGNPGSGKSIMASSIISSLKKRSFAGTCQYHFFLAGHQTKRTLAYLLRSVALQIAQSHGVFCSRVLELHENTGIIFSQQKENFIWEKIFEGILFRIPSQEPLFWVFDGLDEAESPSDLIRFVSRIKAATRINVLLISRATKDLLKNMNNYLPTTVHEVISADDVVDDIKDYVRSSIQKIIPSNRAQEEVVENILCKASGSFLWVKLALDRIRDNWYTEDDIKAALTEMPEGMQSMYERMIEVIAGQSSKVCQMATRILIWVACCFRPLEIAEIKVALEPEFKGFVNLEQTIEEICGHFVVVKRLKITLIHETASQFLLKKTSNLRIAIVENEGHEHIARVCISFLSDATKWRRVFSAIEVNQQLKSMSGGVATFEGHPFLSYALTFWAYHVSLAPVDSDDLLEVVLTFLEEYCLVWINGIGLFRNLRILTNAAQNLKKYSKRRANSVAKRPPHSFKMSRDIELRQWANDLIRLVGRFGNNIAEIPSSIHKYVIPFCPKDSIISKSFSHVGRSTFSVTGMSSRHWDDCLARLTMGEDRTASKVFCKDTFFVTLVGVDGTLIIWHSETCQELRRFAHGEYVSQLASSKTTNFIATAGFKTTRIWDITTGEEVRRLPKERYHHTRALAFSAEDDDILVAYDDCSVQCFNIVTGQEKWRFLAKDPNSKDHNCARYMAFSPDLAQIAIVFRGRPLVVWGIQPSQISHISPKKCVVMEDSMRSAVEGDAWNAPEMVLWQPGSDHLLILYEDTKVVDWNITDDEQMQYDHTGARGMVLSPDGNLVLTSDVNGTLSIWTIPEFRLTYQLKYEELVMDLAFSPDGTRFYDIRGSFCNVWEPDALVRPNDIDQDNTSSNYETIASEPVISSDDNTRTPITALVGDSLDRAYCCGKDDGTVVMYDIPEGRKLRKIISHSSSVSIIKLAWSDSEKFLASADDSGRVIAKRLEPPTDRQGKWAVFPLFDKRIEEAVEQLLFSAREEFILIAGRTTSCVMNLKSKKELCCVRHPNQSVGLWVTHPSNPLMLVRLDASQENEYFWKTLAPKDTSIESTVQAPHFTETSDILQQTIQCQAHWLVFEVVIAGSHHAGSPSRRIEAYDLRKLHESRSHETSARHRIEGLAEHVRRLIGCVQDRVVFIDHQFWLCTWEMEQVYSKHKRHFFLPKDWLSSTALSLMVLNTSGTLLCPRNGEVAIVRSGFKY